MRAQASTATIDKRPWRIVAASIAGLIIAIAAAGVIVLLQVEEVMEVTDRALMYDLEVEDEGDDLRVAVLDVRHYHRDILLNGPTHEALLNYEEAYAKILEEIDELEDVGITEPGVPSAVEIRELAERYYADYWPDVELYDTDRPAFIESSNLGLRRIAELDRAASEIDNLGERLAEDSLTRVDSAAETERFVLLALLVGIGIIGVVLAVTSVAVLNRLRASYSREREAVLALEGSLRTKTDFISDASHELRTPLTVIQGNAEIGLELKGDEGRHEALEAIAKEANRMGKLIDDLLFLARSDAGFSSLEKELVPARWLVQRIMQPAEVLTQKRGSCLEARLSGEGYLIADPARVEQAVLALIDNAAKHSPSGACVVLTMGVRQRQLEISVTDSGPGIPPDELPLIFDRFYRVGARRVRKKEGSGLGLSITKTIVEAHSGFIQVDSRVGAGTKVTIALPLCELPYSIAQDSERLQIA
jgi:signal transduction histidine kinase